jgi:hypothetical protein
VGAEHLAVAGAAELAVAALELLVAGLDEGAAEVAVVEQLGIAGIEAQQDVPASVEVAEDVVAIGGVGVHLGVGQVLERGEASEGHAPQDRGTFEESSTADHRVLLNSQRSRGG